VTRPLKRVERKRAVALHVERLVQPEGVALLR
jgi:hypothetical protein